MLLHALRRTLRFRHGGLIPFLGIFLGVSFLTRCLLLLKSRDGVSWDMSLLTAFAVGFGLDMAMALLFALPFALLLFVVPRRVFVSKPFRWAMHAVFVGALAVFLFTAVSEWLFWDEFGVRFNFIAVDYLVYTTEVIRNIRESYNMPAIFAGLFAATGLIWYGVCRTRIHLHWLDSHEAASGKGRHLGLAFVVVPVAIAFGAFFVIGSRDMRGGHAGFLENMSAGLRHMGEVQPSLPNSYNTELAKNGPYAFVSAFWGNELDYDKFYPTRPGDESFLRLRKHLQQDNVRFVTDDAHPRDITRVIRGAGEGKRLNVIQITVESLSAEFLGCYGDPKYAPMNLTPNLDRIAGESVWFRHLYAGGTRTVRGMETLSLSVPPTPGQAILRRPHCENLATVGSVFANRGYDLAFVYGGDGMFDNMNYFFANNGFRVVDQPAKLREHPDTKLAFANAWGASDEDLFAWVIADADSAYAAGKPFFRFVMTTSNHRPYTWPAGRIDPKLNGREGGVAYTDYAIGKLLRDASTKPWFKDTVFVIVADHCASVAGRRELEVRKYEIPMFIHCPAHFAPQRVDALCSQIDYGPTLLGLLDWSYVSRFFGRDMLRSRPGDDRAFISNYQKIGLLQEGDLAVLKPVKIALEFDCNLATGELTPQKPDECVDDAIAWYGCASWLFRNGGMAAVPADKENELLRSVR